MLVYLVWPNGCGVLRVFAWFGLIAALIIVWVWVVGVMFCSLVVAGLGSLLWRCLVVRFWLRGLLGCLVVGFACGGS